MKKVLIMLTFILGSSVIVASAQTATKSTITTSANEVLEGTIKDQMQKKGEIIFTDAAGSSKRYSPADISGFTMDGVKYISYANDFYKVVSTGTKASLYVRVTDNSGKTIFNGAEPVMLTTAEGRKGDYYLQIKADGKFNHVNKKNFLEVVGTACADCSLVQNSIKSGQLGYDQLAKAVEQYNNCL
ncbi:MAG: hypothetical protein ACK4S0_04200 [Sediminibacterium sp.]